MGDPEVEKGKEALSPRSTEVEVAGDILSLDEVDSRSLAVGVEFRPPQFLECEETSLSDAGLGWPLSTEGEHVIMTQDAKVGTNSLSWPPIIDGSAVLVSGLSGSGEESHSPSPQYGEPVPICEVVQDEGCGVPFPEEDDEVLASGPSVYGNERHVTVLLEGKEPSFAESYASLLQERKETSALAAPKAGSDAPPTSVLEAEKDSVFEVAVARVGPDPPPSLAGNVAGFEISQGQTPEEEEVHLSEAVFAGPDIHRLESLESVVSGYATLEGELRPSIALGSLDAPAMEPVVSVSGQSSLVVMQAHVDHPLVSTTDCNLGVAYSPVNKVIDAAFDGAYGSCRVSGDDIEMIRNECGNEVEAFKMEAEITGTSCTVGAGDAAVNREVEPLSGGANGRDEVSVDENEMGGNMVAGVEVENLGAGADITETSCILRLGDRNLNEVVDQSCGGTDGRDEVALDVIEIARNEVIGEDFEIAGSSSLGVGEGVVNEENNPSSVGFKGRDKFAGYDIELARKKVTVDKIDISAVEAEIATNSFIAEASHRLANEEVDPSSGDTDGTDGVAKDEIENAGNKVAGEEVIFGAEAEIAANSCIVEVDDGVANKDLVPSFGDADGDGVAEVEIEMPIYKVAGDEVDISEVEGKIICNSNIPEAGDGVVNEGVDPSAGGANKDEVTEGEIEMAGNKVAGAEFDISEAGTGIGRTSIMVGVGDGAVSEEVDPFSSDADGRYGISEDVVVMGGNNFAGDEVAVSREEREITRNDIIVAVGDGTVNKDVNTSSGDADEVDGVAGDEIGMIGNDGSKAEIEIAGLEVEIAGDELSEDDIYMIVDAKRRGGRRAKRGRPPSGGQGTGVLSRRKEEEEVCFICFDGGDLVVCDRRRCPKVYHPSCVNRDVSYFRAKGQWNCGWHICSKCEKSASFMCYTCTYSLCKLCIKESGFTCIRRNKGFCESCIRTVLLIETNEYTKENMDGVNFDDCSCWEYLFKDYWLELKKKLSLTLEELSKDRTSLKVFGSEIAQVEASDDDQGTGSGGFLGGHEESIPSRKKSKKLSKSTDFKDGCGQAAESERISIPGGTSAQKRMKKNSEGLTEKSSRKEVKSGVETITEENFLRKRKKGRPRKTTIEDFLANDGETQEVLVSKDNSSRKKMKKRSKRVDQVNTEKEQTSVTEDVHWASNELLNFVAHIKNGDKGILSQYDVQELLLEYIKVNKLRDPRKKSQIVCDAMLQALFGKPRVGHFEMLKLLESHFFVKEVSSPLIDENQGEVVDTDFNHMGSQGNNDAEEKMTLDKRRKVRKRMEKEQQANFYDYAAIDAHNINLMYLRRSLMEELMNDMNTFHEKVIGSFVRIRVTASSQRQEVYRLVQVVGCGKAPEKYKTGKRTTDIMLEVINLDKKEVITIDIISNQEFTEEECKRLRQSIKFGFIGRLTMGEIQEKARVLQAVRINDYLENEKLRFSHLRDRASETGRIKEHRECVEKLQLLSTPEEYTRRLIDIPEVHVDPNMDPDYESPEDERDQDDNTSDRPTLSFLKGRELASPKQVGVYNWSGSQQSSNNVLEFERTRPKDFSPIIEKPTIEAGRGYGFSSSLGDEAQQKNDVVTPRREANAEAWLFDGNKPVKEPSVQPEPQLQNLPKIVLPSSTTDSEKLWHYKDPSGKIQGPFSIVQLKKWSKHFPSNLRIWQKSETQEDSILLTDALAGNFQKDLPEWVPEYKNPNQPAKVMENYSEVALRRIDNPTGTENKNTGTASNSVQVNSPAAVAPSNGSPFQPKHHEFEGVQAAGTYALQSTGRELHGSWNVNMTHEILSGEQASSKDPRRNALIQQASTECRNSLPANVISTQQSDALLNMHAAVQRRDRDQENVQSTLNKCLLAPIISGNNTHQSPTATKEINEVMAVVNCGISSSKTEGTVNSLRIGLQHGNSKPDGLVIPCSLSSQGSHAVDQKLSTQNSIPLVGDSRKETQRKPDSTSGIAQHFISDLGINVLSKGQSTQPSIEASVDISTLKGHFPQKPDVASSLVSDGQNNLISVRSDKQIDPSTSSTESNTGPEIAPRNPHRMSFQHCGASNAKPVVESNIVESVSPQRSDASTFPKPGFDVRQSASFNSSKRTPDTSVVTSNTVNAYEQTQSGNLQSSHWGPQVPMNMKNNEQSVPTMLSIVNSVAGTSLNSPNNNLSSSDASKPQLSSSQMNNNPAAAAVFQSSNMSWGNVANDGQNPGWQVPAQYPQASLGNMICGPGLQGGFGPTNLDWGIMAQGNMNMAWGVQPNMNMAWGPMTTANVNNNSGVMMPTPGNATTNYGWGTPPSVPINLIGGCRPPAQGIATPNAVWGIPNQGNASQQGPVWFPPAVGNTNQNAWGVGNQGNMSANNAFGTVQGNMNPTWDSSTGNPSGSTAQPEQFRDGYPGSGYGSVRHPWNMMPSRNAEGTSLPQEQRGICKFHENGHCKKGAFCNYVHL